MANIPTALRIAQSIQWAVTPEYLAIIEEIAAGNTDPVAVATQLGRPLQNTRTVSYRDNVAIIPVHSVIFRRASMFDDLSGGAASVQTLALDFKQAETDPAIDTILLDFDSPGGEVNGISELAQIIKRCQKRTVAYVGDQCASAAYWLAAACDEICMYKTAKVGSVGIQAIASIARDPNRKIFTSRQSPDKNVRADTERGATLIQTEIDKTAQIFIEDVATMRGVSVDLVLANYGNGAEVMAADAIAAGMADRVLSFEDLMKELQQTGKPEALSAYAVNDKAVLAFEERVRTALSTQADKDEEDMNKEIVQKMLAGLSEEERTEVLASLNVTATGDAAPAAVPASPATAIQQPTVAPATPAAPAQAAVAASAAQPAVVDAAASLQNMQTQLNAERTARITAECDAFISSMKVTGKVTPAEEADVKTLFTSLAGMPDVTALNQYKASIQARPTNPMLQETVANGQLNVLNNGTTDTRTEAEKEAALVENVLAMTSEGQDAAKALKEGKGNIKAAFKQFAISQ